MERQVLNIMNKLCDSITSDKLREAVVNVEERLLDIQTLLQLLELSLLDNQDDKHLVRTVNIICKLFHTFIEKEFMALKEMIKVNKV